MTIRRRTLLGAAIAAPTLAASARRAASAQTRKVLRIGIGTSPNTLDPMLTTIGDEYIYRVLVFNGLTRIREDLKLEGDLAESWSISEDIKTWTFKLRTGVKFAPVGRPVRERLAVTLQQLAKPGGFDLQVQRVPYSNFSAEVSGKAPLYIDGFFGRPTIDTSLYAFLRSKGSWNERLWHYSNAEVDKPLDAARLTADLEVQKTRYIAFQSALVADPASFFAYAVNFACAYRTGVAVQTHPMRWFDLRRATLVSS